MSKSKCFGQTNVPPGLNNVTAISAGYLHNLALKSDGTVVTWGYNFSQTLDVPPGLNGVVAIAAGAYFSLALQNNGFVAGWGIGTPIDLGTFVSAGANNVAIAAGTDFAAVLKNNGTVVVWGGFFSSTPPGLANVTKIAAGDSHVLALKSDGTVVAWGDNSSGELFVPRGLTNVVSIAAGFGSSAALRSTSVAPLPVAVLDRDNFFDGALRISGNNTLELGAGIAGREAAAGTISYQKYSGGLDIVGAGTTVANRSITFFAEGGAHFTGGANFDGRIGIGIGTASPTRQLEVQGAGDVEIGLKSTDLNGRLWTIQSSGNGTPGRERTFQIIDRTVSASRLLINDAGLIGVGTASPSGQLTVQTTDDSTPATVTSFNARHLVVGTPSAGVGVSYSATSGKGYLTALAPNVAWKDLVIQASTLSFRPSGGTETLSILNNGNVAIASPASLFFGAQTRQMLNLSGASYGIGVQTATTYFRSAGGYSWFNGGVHNDGQNDAGGGGELMRLTSGGNLNISGAFGSLSDRNAKEQFEPLNPREVLEKVAALPLSRWNYKTDPTARHLGPMAQDFYSAFGLGTDDKHIATVDADGVALAAIQGLNEKVEDRSQKSEARNQRSDFRIQKLETENAELKQRLDTLEKFTRNQNSN